MFCSAQMFDLQKKSIFTLFTRLLLLLTLKKKSSSQNVKHIQTSNPNPKAIQLLNHKPI
jgi:hypothetical protein